MECARQVKARRLTSLNKPPSLHGEGGVRSDTAIGFPRNRVEQLHFDTRDKELRQ
jgi:hypothetical protein